ncbi:MAG TPA: DUF992 domain-containing protein [Casimicrobiaceae bacterium]|nr:DUF992 domain-containing protein [Casimicrobiaceae bacterium]
MLRERAVIGRFLVTIALLSVALGGIAPLAEAEDKGATVGMLRCNESDGWGLVFGSTRDLNCVFTSSDNKTTSRFKGTIKKYGVDIGYTANAVILWAVISTNQNFAPGDLAGSYAGATAQVAWAAGLGANVLLGGSKQGFALQPVSVAGMNGVNVAAGLTGVDLAPAK